MTYIFLFLLLSLIIQGHSLSSLIVCNYGCGCITDTGISVSCDFTDRSASTVIQAKIKSEGLYQAEHVITIGTSFTADEHFSSKPLKCPKVAGKPSSGKCVVEVESQKSADMPMKNGEVMEEDIGNRSGEFVVSMGQKDGNGILLFEIGKNVDMEGELQSMTRQVGQARAIGGFSNCRPNTL